MATVPVESRVEKLRVLSAAANDSAVAAANNLNWLTPEFWTMVATAGTNLVAVAVLLGWVNTMQAEDLTKALSALVGATQVIVLNTALVWQYLRGRSQLRAKLVDAHYAYLTAAHYAELREGA